MDTPPDDERRMYLTGLAARFPALRNAETQKQAADSLGLSLSTEDGSILCALSDEKVDSFRADVQQEFADIVPYGI